MGDTKDEYIRHLEEENASLQARCRALEAARLTHLSDEDLLREFETEAGAQLVYAAEMQKLRRAELLRRMKRE